MRFSGYCFALALLLGACSSDSTAPNSPVPVAASVLIEDPGLVRDGDVRSLTAEVRDASNRVLPNVAVQWATTDPTVAVITPTGLLTALREGPTEVVAIAGAVQHRRLLNVVLHPAVTIELATNQLVVPLGTRKSLQVTLRGLDGRTLLNRPLTLTSSDESVARTLPNGEVIPLKPGVAVITARYGTLSANATVSVPGETGAVVYAVREVDGKPLPAVIDERERDEGNARVYEITRLESGTVTLGEMYDVTMSVAYYERTVLNGVSTERLLSRANIRDFGEVTYNWLTGNAALESTYVGGLSHALDWVAAGPRLQFREPGMPTIWALGLHTPAP